MQAIRLDEGVEKRTKKEEKEEEEELRMRRRGRGGDKDGGCGGERQYTPQSEI